MTILRHDEPHFHVTVQTYNGPSCSRIETIPSPVKSSTVAPTKASFNKNKWLAKMIHKELIKCLHDFPTKPDDQLDDFGRDSLSSLCFVESRNDHCAGEKYTEPTPAGWGCTYDLPTSDMTIKQLQHYVVSFMPHTIQRAVSPECWGMIFGTITSTKESMMEDSIQTASRRVQKLIAFGKKRGMLIQPSLPFV